MTNSRLALLIAAILALTFSVAWGFRWYNTQQQEALEQAEISLDEGIALFRAKKYAESLEVFGRIPEGVLHDWHFPYYEATANVMLKDYQSAAPLLEEALALNPQETKILFELGVVYFKLGNLAMSKAYFASVVELDPGNEEARGLMNVMADLERNQPGASAQESEQEPESGGTDY